MNKNKAYKSPCIEIIVINNGNLSKTTGTPLYRKEHCQEATPSAMAAKAKKMTYNYLKVSGMTMNRISDKTNKWHNRADTRVNVLK